MLVRARFVLNHLLSVVLGFVWLRTHQSQIDHTAALGAARAHRRVALLARLREVLRGCIDTARSDCDSERMRLLGPVRPVDLLRRVLFHRLEDRVDRRPLDLERRLPVSGRIFSSRLEFLDNDSGERQGLGMFLCIVPRAVRQL